MNVKWIGWKWHKENELWDITIIPTMVITRYNKGEWGIEFNWLFFNLNINNLQHLKDGKEMWKEVRK